jgi:hypothetical protein
MVAASGNLEELKMVAAEDPESLHAGDSNGWKPIHEAARSGRTNILEYLVEEGADVNERMMERRSATVVGRTYASAWYVFVQYCRNLSQVRPRLLSPFFVSHLCAFCLPDQPTIAHLRGNAVAWTSMNNSILICNE